MSTFTLLQFSVLHASRNQELLHILHKCAKGTHLRIATVQLEWVDVAKGQRRGGEILQQRKEETKKEQVGKACDVTSRTAM